MTNVVDILVIDDEQVILDAIVKICTSEGFRVDTALDALEGLRRLTTHRYTLVLSDIMMPGMDGFQFLKEAAPVAPHTPVIMTTGFSTVENAVHALYAGAIDFVPKPFTTDELLSSVHRALRYRHLRNAGLPGSEEAKDPAMVVVPCPARYYRLGYASWVFLEPSGSVLVGATHAFLKTVEQVDTLEAVLADGELIQGTCCLRVHTQDGLIHAILSPVSGRVVDSNTALFANPGALEKDPYFGGWLYRAIPADIQYELGHLVPCSSDNLF
jgi:CheY-like chemotaxis protein/glycine cleavage system H lipoate-binding protein